MTSTIIALGGNALLLAGDRPSTTLEQRRADAAIRALKQVLSEHRVAITHGNGPQVGNQLSLSEHRGSEAYPLPLDLCVAATQAEIGSILVRAIGKILPEETPTTVLTHLLVDPKDPAFTHPTKPIGRFHPHSSFFRRKKLPYVHQPGKGYRRVVASPMPLKVIEAAQIKTLLRKTSVICCGGGGIPLVRRRGRLVGVDAVIDKDHASARLGLDIHAHTLMILTDVDRVCLDYGTKTEQALHRLGSEEARSLLNAGQFPAGTMGPKIEAALHFLEGSGKRVLITSPKQLGKALRGRGGTWIQR